MSQAIIDPEEVRRFAAELKRFDGDLRERTGSLMARFTALGNQVNALAARDGKPALVPIVFEGNAPADVRDNAELSALLRSRPSTPPLAARAWLGTPNSIKGPTEARFQRQSGSHLLIIGQSAERAKSLLATSIVSLSAQYPAGGVGFVILDPHAHDPGIFQRLAATDTWNNVSRWIPRKLMAEFEMRVLFQLSDNDSANLIDSPAATTLGLHRALFHNEHQGALETFRPYAMPEEAWLDEIG